MAPINQRTSRRGFPSVADEPKAKPVGLVRRSQSISTYGIGAIVDLEAGSFMAMGLDDWPSARPGTVISESRLQVQLGVDHFRLPPVAEDIPSEPGFVKARPTVPAVRFPEWQECPKCHRLGTLDAPFERSSDGNRMVCQQCGPKSYVNPVRFVVACRKGHIEEFPWHWWVHQDAPCSQSTSRLFLRSHGKSSSLADLYIKCMTCKRARSLADAYGEAGMRGRRCGGIRPWLFDRVRGCDAPPRVLQRGASNIYFPIVASSISIPPASEAEFQVIEENWITLKAIPEAAIRDVLAGIADAYDMSVTSLLAAYHNKRALVQPGAQYTDIMGRAEEYAALSTSRHDEPAGGYVPQFQNSVGPAPPGIAKWFEAVGAVSRLREVRALAAFARIEPHPLSAERIPQAISDGLVAPLSKRPLGWLPAAEIRGEGIFLRFRTDAIDHWIQENPALIARARALDECSESLAVERGFKRDYAITPRLLLVHSFSHALIRQLSLDCGYSSSALRERLYVREAEAGTAAMNGVLIYTGSPDSEGSLGGLVRYASPTLIEAAVLRAIRAAGWCGSDPVCLETDPVQSGERVAGAACHCCLLVPETACEKFNRELDRTTLVGDSEGAWNGFFLNPKDWTS